MPPLPGCKLSWSTHTYNKLHSFVTHLKTSDLSLFENIFCFMRHLSALSIQKICSIFVYHFPVISHLFSTNCSFSELWHKTTEITYMSHNKLVLRSQTSNKGGISYETCLQIASCIDDTVIPSAHINLAWLFLNIMKKRHLWIYDHKVWNDSHDKNFLNSALVFHENYIFPLCRAADYMSLTHVYLQTCSECVCTRKCSRSLEYSSDHSRQ